MFLFVLIFVFAVSDASYAYNPELQDAIDNPTLDINTTGDANWYKETIVTHDGTDAAQSGDINDAQYTTMVTNVTGPGTISFWWKVSSEPNDKLTFYDGENSLNSISGNIDWNYQTFYIGPGTRTLSWKFSKDGSTTVMPDCGWVDQVIWTPTPLITLPEALDNTTLTWVTYGSINNWYGQTTNTHDGTDAAQSDHINNGQYTTISTTTNGPGTIGFWWKVSSEPTWDYLTFKDNGNVLQRISGNIDWNYLTFNLGPGTHTLEWSYTKDYSNSIGFDCGWLDEVSWTPLNITIPEALDNTSLTWNLGGNAEWFGENTITHDLSDAAQSDDINDGQNTSISSTVNGPGTISFWWKVSSEQNYDFLIFRDNGITLNRISGDNDWNYQTFNLESGIHNLEWIYSKDNSESAGYDCGWLDQINWTPTMTGNVLLVRTGIYYSTITEAINNSIVDDVLEVDPATYTENLNIGHRLMIQSTGDALNTIIQAANVNLPVFNILTNGSEIHGFTIRGASASTGITLSHADNCLVQSNNITGNLIGIMIQGNQNIININTINNNLWAGICADTVTGANITGNTVSGNQEGVYLLNTSSGTVNDNQLINNNVNGLNIQGGNQNNITNNNISGNGVSTLGNGVILRNSAQNALYQNIVQNNGWSGIVLDASSNNYIGNFEEESGNTIIGNDNGLVLYGTSSLNNIGCNAIQNNHYNGLELYSGCEQNTISQNSFNDNGVIGILIQYSNNNTIETNTLQNGNYNGIVFDNSSNNHIQNNHINNVGNTTDMGGIGILMVQNSNQNTINSNELNGNIWTNIVLDHCSQNQVTDNTINGNHTSQQGILLLNNCNQNTINSNTINNNTAVGISLQNNCYTNNINQNTVTSNGIIGILLDTSNNNNLNHNTLQNNGWAGTCLSGSTGNTLTLNNYLSNPEQAYDNGTNTYDNGTNGNYYDNWTTTNPRPVGGGNNVDHYPILNPVQMIHTITAISGLGGSISPNGSVNVNYGYDQTFNITPESGYRINDVLVDGNSQGSITSYTFNDVTADHTINASFTQIQYCTIAIIFGNVPVVFDPGMSVPEGGTIKVWVTVPAGMKVVATLDVDQYYYVWENHSTSSANIHIDVQEVGNHFMGVNIYSL